MKLYSPAWIIAIGAVLVSTSGVLSTVGSALVGIDSAIHATIDLRTFVAKIVPPKKVKFVAIKPITIPAKAKKAPSK